jgi:hypothetical protein
MHTVGVVSLSLQCVALHVPDMLGVLFKDSHDALGRVRYHLTVLLEKIGRRDRALILPRDYLRNLVARDIGCKALDLVDNFDVNGRKFATRLGGGGRTVRRLFPACLLNRWFC